MDKTIEQIFRIFNHIVRELQVYFISGLMVILNIYMVDFFYYQQTLYKVFGQKEFLIPGIIIAYVIGHICMAFFYVLFEWKKLDKKINKKLGFEYNVESSILPDIYKKDKESYIHFIERYVILSMMRWTLSAAFFINFLIDLYYTIFKQYYWQVCLQTILSLLTSIIMYILTTKTENDYSDRITSMKNN